MRFPLLALLASGPAHGYELKQALEQRFGSVLPPLNAGQIYTTLSRLERDGLVDDDAVAQNGRPNKRVYRLTDQGRIELSGWVADSTPATRLKDDFFIKLVLARAAGIAEPLELIDRQRSAYLQALRDLDDVAVADDDRRAARGGRCPAPRGGPQMAGPLRTTNDEWERPMVIVARGLTRNYDGVLALDGVDVEVPEGEFVAITGPSGCGKSTLLNLLGGLDRPSAGEIELGGRRVDGFSEAKWAHVRRSEIGFVFQFFNLIGNLSVADNVELPGLLAGLSAREARTRRGELLETLGIAEHAAMSPTRLSGGQQQRVAIARALINRPRVLLADEPTGNLDSASARDVMALLRTMHDERGQTIVLVTHDARVAARADRVISMRDGRIANETRLDEGRSDVAATVSRLMQLGV